MGFQHPHQQAHKLAGMAAAAASRNTPSHLKPHLEKAAMIKKHGQPITGAKPQMKPKLPTPGPGTTALQSQVKAPPAPFKNPQGAANLSAPAGPTGATGGTKGQIGKKSRFFGGH